MPKKSSLAIKKGDVSPAEYTKFITSLKAKIRSAQIKAAVTVNNEFPGVEGFSRRNMFRMKAFYQAYAKVPQAVAQLDDLPIFSIPWGHNALILEKKIPHVCSFQPDYVLFQIEDLFVVGYGLDYQERYRGLNGIYFIPK